MQGAKLSLARVILLCPLFFSPAPFAQLLPVAPPDHVHMAVPDVDKTIDWYARHFGGIRFRILGPS
jgi:hypothetical protein